MLLFGVFKTPLNVIFHIFQYTWVGSKFAELFCVSVALIWAFKYPQMGPLLAIKIEGIFNRICLNIISM